MSNMNLNSLVAKKLDAPFVPRRDVLHCDPTYELEEMIVEARPLHKKKKRLLQRQQTLLTQYASNDHHTKDPPPPISNSKDVSTMEIGDRNH